MKIAVLSGKGGAGKTFISVNLAVASEKSTYIDCDVEEPNGRLFLKPENVETKEVFTCIPAFDANKCTGCKECVKFCHFNALVYIKNKPKVFNDVCHFCGGCKLVCPNDAITEDKRKVGIIEQGFHNNVKVITGVLNTGESSSIPVIKQEFKEKIQDGVVIIDSPPGSACSVMESISDADYCVIVAEPTAFGFHNFKMVYELCKILNKKCGIVINKVDESYTPLTDFCKENDLEVILEIPYDERIASENAKGNIASEIFPNIKDKFVQVLSHIEKQVTL